MKKWLSLTLAIFMVFTLCACGSSPSTSQTDNQIQTQLTQEEVYRLKQGDEVSIVGQKANSTLVNENTIWVQVQQNDGTFIVYHCQMKDEYLTVASELKMMDVVKVKGFFLSYTDLDQENTAPLVTLYDCELIED
jgi:RPA family protein